MSSFSTIITYFVSIRCLWLRTFSGKMSIFTTILKNKKKLFGNAPVPDKGFFSQTPIFSRHQFFWEENLFVFYHFFCCVLLFLDKKSAVKIFTANFGVKKETSKKVTKKKIDFPKTILGREK